MRDIRLIVIHHSGSSPSTTAKTIKKWHMDPNKKGGPFSDIGYNGVIEQGGIYVPGRPITKMTAAQRGANKYALAICAVGDNTKVGWEWDQDQITTLRRFLWVWCEMFPLAKIAGHCDVGRTRTLCPGIDVREMFKGFPAVHPREET